MEELQNRLLYELKALITHLDKYGEYDWSQQFSLIKNSINNGNIKGIDALKKVRGGMGSFTDLIICQANGHNINKNEEGFANTELWRLGGIVFSTADDIKKELKKEEKVKK